MKVVAIIQARMGSNRLPGKVMRELDGHPMIYHTINRLKKAKYVDKVVLATSNKSQDTLLAEYVQSLGIAVFRGDEADVLERYYDAVRLYGGDVIVRVTGDCPLLDPVIVDNVITRFLSTDKDYIRLDVPNTFLRGFDVEVFSEEALQRAYTIVTTKDLSQDVQRSMYAEHVTYYMYTHLEEFKVGHVVGEHPVDKAYNLSVDTIEDFNRAQKYIHYKGYKDILNDVQK